MGALSIRSWTFNNHPFENELRRITKKFGFIKNKRHAIPMVLYYKDSETIRPSITNINNWYVSMIFTEGWYG